MSVVERYPIICGFPGVGKTTLTNVLPERFIDSDSQSYHWIVEKCPNGNKIPNPEFPQNYIDALSELSTAMIPFCSTHRAVREALRDNNLKVIVVKPSKNVNKIEYCKRFIGRLNGINTEEFASMIYSKWDEFMSDLDEEFPNEYHITLSGDYLTLAEIERAIQHFEDIEEIKSLK